MSAIVHVNKISFSAELCCVSNFSVGLVAVSEIITDLSIETKTETGQNLIVIIIKRIHLPI